MTKHEKVMRAFHRLLMQSGAKVIRGPVSPDEGIGDKNSGLIIFDDGDPPEPEVSLSPLTYYFEHPIEIGVIVKQSGKVFEAMDDLIEKIGRLIVGDRTLGGLADWIEAGPRSTLGNGVEWGDEARTAGIVITIHYTTSDPLA